MVLNIYLHGIYRYICMVFTTEFEPTSARQGSTLFFSKVQASSPQVHWVGMFISFQFSSVQFSSVQFSSVQYLHEPLPLLCRYEGYESMPAGQGAGGGEARHQGGAGEAVLGRMRGGGSDITGEEERMWFLHGSEEATLGRNEGEEQATK